MYTDVLGAGSCKPCPAGRYCSMAGLTEPEGPCQPGYYCSQGSSSSSPVSTQYLVLLQTIRHYERLHGLHQSHFLCFRWAFRLEISVNQDITVLLAQDTRKRWHVLLAPGMARGEPRMPLGVFLVPLGSSAVCLAKMLP